MRQIYQKDSRMTHKNQIVRQYNVLNMCKNVSSVHWNCFKINRNEGKKHRMRKFEIQQYFVDRGYKTLTEAEFKDIGGRCDVLVIGVFPDEDARIFEVYDSEKEKSIILKTKKYPYPLVAVPAKGDFDEKMVL